MGEIFTYAYKSSFKIFAFVQRLFKSCNVKSKKLFKLKPLLYRTEKMSENKKYQDKRKFVDKLSLFLSNVTVEPLIFCNYLAIGLYLVVVHSGLYEVICEQNFHQIKDLQCHHAGLAKRPDIEVKVQRIASNVNMYLSLFYLIPAIVSDIFMGAWADLNGRKMNILLGLAGLAIAAFPYSIVFTYPQTPLFILAIANLVTGVTGFVPVVMISSLAYLTDIVPDKKQLTTRMAHVIVFQNLGTAIGSFSSGYLIQKISLPYVIVIVEIILVIGYIYTLIRIKMVPPLLVRRMVLERANGVAAVVPVDAKVLETKSGTVAIKTEPISCLESVENNLKFIGKMYKEVWHTFSRPRPGHRRCYIYLMTLIYLLFFIGELGLMHGPVISLFVFHPPFNWTAVNLGYWKGTQQLLLMVGNLLGSLIMKNILNFKETTVMMVCLGSGIIFLLVLAFSQSTWMMYLSLVLGMLANLTVPTIKSFIAQLVDADEVGKAFTANGVTADLAFVFSTLLFNNIYSNTVSTFPGAVFAFAAGLLAICFLIMLGVHIDMKRFETLENKSNNSDMKSVTRL